MTAGKHAAGKLIPLRCMFCGETWAGRAASIGTSCPDRGGMPAGCVDVFQCSPEELDPDWSSDEAF